MASVEFKTSGGKNPQRFVADLADSMRPTLGDALFAANLQRTRVLTRTQRGVDVNGRAFAPYSDIGPIYIDVGRKSGAGRSTKQKRSATQRFARKVGLKLKASPLKKANKASRRQARPIAAKRSRKPPRFRFISGVTPIGGITPGGLLKVASYAAFKLQVLGRSAVDLFGHRAPHMLQAMVVRLGGQERRAERVGALEHPQPPREVGMGFFGEEAGRAIAHNDGAGNLPRRHFFGFSRDDVKKIVTDVRGRIRERIRKAS